MSFKKVMALTCSVLIFSTTPLLAKTYKLKQSAEYACGGESSSDGGCDISTMTDVLMNQCHNDGYTDCEASNYSKIKKIRWSSCDDAYKEVCTVKVKGRI